MQRHPFPKPHRKRLSNSLNLWCLPLPVSEKPGILCGIREMQKYLTNEETARDLYDLGLEKYLRYLN